MARGATSAEKWSLSSKELGLNTTEVRNFPTKIHQNIRATFGEFAVPYGIVKRWCRQLKCGRTSCKNESGDGPSKTVPTAENINKAHCKIDECEEIHYQENSRENRRAQYFDTTIGDKQK